MDLDIQKITKYIFLESKPQKADLAIVFGTRHREPIDKAYELYKNKLIPKILVSGGTIPYEDKLDGNITQEFYSQKFDEYSNKIKELDRRVSKYTDADIDYYKFGTSILELANKASFLYKKANPDEKQELLNFLLSNSTLEHQKVLINYKKPFNRVFARATCSDWRVVRDLNPRSPP